MDRKDRVPIARADLQETDMLAIANQRALAIDGNNQGTITYEK